MVEHITRQINSPVTGSAFKSTPHASGAVASSKKVDNIVSPGVCVIEDSPIVTVKPKRFVIVSDDEDTDDAYGVCMLYFLL